MSETKIYMVQVCLEYGHCISMQFTSKRRARKAQKEISDGMGKGRLRNEASVLTIDADATTYSVDTSRAISVACIDSFAWNDLAKISQDQAKSIGVDMTAGVHP